MSPDDDIEWLKAEIARMRSMLEPLESGKIRINGRRPNQPWADATRAQISSLRRGIAVYQSIVDSHESKASERRRGNLESVWRDSAATQ